VRGEVRGIHRSPCRWSLPNPPFRNFANKERAFMVFLLLRYTLEIDSKSAEHPAFMLERMGAGVMISASSSTHASETMTICHIFLPIYNRRIVDTAACSIFTLPGSGSETQKSTRSQSPHPPPRDPHSRTSATSAPSFSVRAFKKIAEHRQVGNAHQRRTCHGL